MKKVLFRIVAHLMAHLMSWTVANNELRKLLQVENRGYNRTADLVKLLWKYIRTHRLSSSFEINLDEKLGNFFSLSKTNYPELKKLFKTQYIVVYRPVIKLRPK